VFNKLTSAKSVRETTVTDRLPVSSLLHVKKLIHTIVSYRNAAFHFAKTREENIKTSSVKPMKLVSLICLVEYYSSNTQLV